MSGQPAMPAKIVVEDRGIFVLVRYPNRKTPDLYVAPQDGPIFCCQCKAELPGIEEFAKHVLARHGKNRCSAKEAEAVG